MTFPSAGSGHRSTGSPTGRPTREEYVAWRTVTTRWRDDDAYGHLNNATYYEMFDTAVNAHLFEATGQNVRLLPQIGVVAETSCRYFRELGFPDPIETGLVVDKVGTSSVVYRIGLFQGESDEAAAEGRFVHVYVDNTDPGRPVTPMPDVIRAAVETLLRRP
jgi:acyl-CoA thioester hydrolase